MKSIINWNKQTLALHEYAKKKGYTVVHARTDDCNSEIDFNTKQITIHSRHTPERQFYLLLHEIGHALVRDNSEGKLFDHAWEDFTLNSATCKLSVIEEEFKAWEAGYNMAKRLGLKLNLRNFQIFRSGKLRTHMEWCVS